MSVLLCALQSGPDSAGFEAARDLLLRVVAAVVQRACIEVTGRLEGESESSDDESSEDGDDNSAQDEPESPAHESDESDTGE